MAITGGETPAVMCMAIDYHGNGRYREIGPVKWEAVLCWAQSMVRVQEVDRAGYTAIYAVMCSYGRPHYFLVDEVSDEGAANDPTGSGQSSHGGSGCSTEGGVTSRGASHHPNR